MIVRAIDSNNDWTFGKGKNDYKKDAQAVSQCIKTRLQSHLGDCFFATNAGVDWWNLLGSKNLIGLKLALSTVILNTQDVSGLLELSVVLDQNRLITITYKAQTVYGEADETFQYSAAG